jgi:hypothetical protein
MRNRDRDRILAEARANVERLKDSEQRFAAEREADQLSQMAQLKSGASNEAPERHVRVESPNERHRRELAAQE